ncbi:hypothetical protein OS493_014421 [Desmophyllum pertusum]|uniref:Uncharacterized protein n=1 Tax=Desmophyllum pertusum TaxID=174260 RepID=A0A9X0CKY5_9CNID|nr:hypothetical protein OS493_014421 [Desmophyllum pertusum]
MAAKSPVAKLFPKFVLFGDLHNSTDGLDQCNSQEELDAIGVLASLQCSLLSGRTSDDLNDPDYIPNLAMGYGDDSKALESSLKKKLGTNADYVGPKLRSTKINYPVKGILNQSQRTLN